MTRRSMLALPFATALLANKWDEPEFPDWSEKFIDRVVTDSPWAQQVKLTIVQPFDQRMVSSFSQIGIGLPNAFPGGSGRSPRFPSDGPSAGSAPILRIAADLTIRWASALPVRRAFALQEFGRHGLEHPRAIELLGQKPPDFVIQIAGIPRTLFEQDGKLLQRHLAETRLAIQGRRAMRPDRIDLPTIGRELTATLRFPRVAVPEDASSIELLSRLGNEQIAQRFRVRSMHYRGRLEL